LQVKAVFRQFRLLFSLGAALGAVPFLLALTVLPRQGEISVLPPAPTAAVTPVPTQLPALRDEAHTLRILLDDGSVAELTLADYLWRVVAAEMPASFEPEALKAQAVCARTYTLWKQGAGLHGEEADLCANSACCQACLDPARGAEKWGSQEGEYREKIARAVSETDGQVLTYEGAPIQALFFSSSTHSTEDAAAVWGSSLPYLVPVDSPEGEEVPNYRTTVTVTAEEMKKLAKAAGATLGKDPGTWISAVSYTSSGRVAELKFGNITLSGGGARSLFSLRSACFTVEEEGGLFTFSVTGYGHGVGMSQYGANAMAAQGSSWQEIVTHYYTGISIEGMQNAGTP